MKIQFTILFIAATFSGFGQFTLNHTDTIPENGQRHPFFVCLKDYGIKRMKFSEAEQKFYLYHLDHSLFREIALPSVPWSPLSYMHIMYISNALFDTNSSTIEYCLRDLNSPYSLRFYNEDGTLIADFDDRWFSYSVIGDFTNPSQYGYPIIATDSGTIMRLAVFAGNTHVQNEYYTLPGKFPDCDFPNGGEVTGVSGTPLRLAGDFIFPNPVFSGQKVTYRMGQDYTHGKLMFFDNSGKKVHHVTLSDSETDIFLERTIFPAGTYFYQFYSDNEAVGAKQLIVVN